MNQMMLLQTMLQTSGQCLRYRRNVVMFRWRGRHYCCTSVTSTSRDMVGTFWIPGFPCKVVVKECWVKNETAQCSWLYYHWWYDYRTSVARCATTGMDRWYTRWCAKHMDKAGSSYHVSSHRCSSNETAARFVRSVLAMGKGRVCWGFIDHLPSRWIWKSMNLCV